MSRLTSLRSPRFKQGGDTVGLADHDSVFLLLEYTASS